MRRALRAHRVVLLPALVAGAFLVGCGEDDDYANDPRPPVPIVLTASIAGDRVSVSPSSFGGGPVTLVVTNQTEETHQLTLRSDGGSAGLDQSTGPINPRETASLKADLAEGDYVITVADSDIEAASLDVGPKRPSAQNELLQP